MPPGSADATLVLHTVGHASQGTPFTFFDGKTPPTVASLDPQGVPIDHHSGATIRVYGGGFAPLFLLGGRRLGGAELQRLEPHALQLRAQLLGILPRPRAGRAGRGGAGARDGGYRALEEIEAWKQRDPITTFAERLITEQRAEQGEIDAIGDEVTALVAAALQFAAALGLGVLLACSNIAWSPASAIAWVVSQRCVCAAAASLRSSYDACALT